MESPPCWKQNKHGARLQVLCNNLRTGQTGPHYISSFMIAVHSLKCLNHKKMSYVFQVEC